MDLLFKTLKYMYINLSSFPSIIVLIGVVVFLYRKNTLVEVQQRKSGGSLESKKTLTLSQILYGFIFGVIVNMIFLLLGLEVLNEYIKFLFVISIILININPKFICFSYSGALLGIISLFLKNANIDYLHFGQAVKGIQISNIILFVGILHIIEGILVMIDGDKGAIRTSKNISGKVIEGYILKRYWILPTLSFYSLIGYKSVTFTRNKREKAILSGIHILIYGLTLLVLLNFKVIFIGLRSLIPLVYMILGHEFMIKIQKKNELLRENKIFINRCGIFISDREKKSFKYVLDDVSDKNKEK